MKEDWEEVKNGQEITTEQLQEIQNLIFNHRKTTIQIPDYYYNWRRNSLEQQSSFAIQEIIDNIHDH